MKLKGVELATKLKGMNPEAHVRAFMVTSDTLVVVAASEYRGDFRLDIRRYWSTYARDGVAEYIPTKKGVSIPEALIPDFLAALVNVIGEFNEDLLDDIR